MKYTFKRLTIENVKEIETWRYNGFMKDIFMKPYHENFKNTGQIVGPLNCHGYGAFYNDELCGLFEYYDIENILEIGLALNPKLVGKGLSFDYIKQGINFFVESYNYRHDHVKLTVEIKNTSAYKAYLKFGFEEVSRNDEEINMIYKLK